MGQNHFAPWPVALYGVVLLLAGSAYFLLTKTLIARHGKKSTLAASIGSDRKGAVSLAVYATAIPVSFCSAVDRLRGLRDGRGHVAAAGSAHRKSAVPVTEYVAPRTLTLSAASKERGIAAALFLR